MDSHTIFIVSIVVIVVIFILVLLATITLSSEKFQNLAPLMPMSKEQSKSGMAHDVVIDTLVPQNLGYRDATGLYNQGMDDGLKGTPLVNVSEVLTNRFPIAIETPMNWYSTQPLVGGEVTLGTNNGKLPRSQCGCNEKQLI